MGHGRTFHLAAQRAEDAGGELLLRIEDIDEARCKAEYTESVLKDLTWMGITFDREPVYQSQRRETYLSAWTQLKDAGRIYPCVRSRKDVAAATRAPHLEDETAEPIFPVEWRPSRDAADEYEAPGCVNWRFRVPDGERVMFEDGRLGECGYTAGKEFGDFLVWRRDDVPAYELAVVVDDAEQAVSEVVRGEDLLLSTARQLLLYRALDLDPPAFYHCALVCDSEGKRLAKRHAALSMKERREGGQSFADALAELMTRYTLS